MQRRWGPPELHDALIALGTALPRRPMRRIYLARLRSICADSKSMAAPGGIFQVPALKAALASLKLGTIGRKAQLAERLCNAVHEYADGDTTPQGAGNTTAVVDTETDMARSSKVRDFEARAAAAWQEHSSDGAFVLEDILDTSVDAEEEDVRAEQEALLQLTEGVNPLNRQLLSSSSSFVLDPDYIRRVLSRGPRAQDPLVVSPELHDRLDPTQRALHDKVQRWATSVAPLGTRCTIAGEALGERWGSIGEALGKH